MPIRVGCKANCADRQLIARCRAGVRRVPEIGKMRQPIPYSKDFIGRPENRPAAGASTPDRTMRGTRTSHAACKPFDRAIGVTTRKSRSDRQGGSHAIAGRST